MVLYLQNRFETLAPENVAKNIIGRQTFIGWPYLQEAKIVCLKDEYFRYEMHGNELSTAEHGNDEVRSFLKSREYFEEHYSKRLGVLTGQVEFLASVRPLSGLTLTHDGSLIKNYGSQVTDFPLQLLVFGAQYEDPRSKAQPAPPTSIDFPVGSLAHFLSPSLYGAICRVEGHPNDNLVNLKIKRPSNVDFRSQPTFSMDIANEELQSLRYMPSWQLSKQMRISGLALSRITSALQIKSSSGKQINAGLCLKFDSKRRKVLGYTEKEERGWTFSPCAVKLILRYQKRFPMIFDALQHKAQADYLTDSDIFPNSKDCEASIQQIKKWLDDEKVKDLVSVPLSSSSLTMVLKVLYRNLCKRLKNW